MKRGEIGNITAVTAKGYPSQILKDCYFFPEEPEGIMVHAPKGSFIVEKSDCAITYDEYKQIVSISFLDGNMRVYCYPGTDYYNYLSSLQ